MNRKESIMARKFRLANNSNKVSQSLPVNDPFAFRPTYYFFYGVSS
jgi:hypothetical protein